MIILAEPTDLDALRLRAEFLLRHGLRVNASQTALLLDLRVSHAAALLRSLEAEGFLAALEDGTYRRVTLPPARSNPARDAETTAPPA